MREARIEKGKLFVRMDEQLPLHPTPYVSKGGKQGLSLYGEFAPVECGRYRTPAGVEYTLKLKVTVTAVKAEDNGGGELLKAFLG